MSDNSVKPYIPYPYTYTSLLICLSSPCPRGHMRLCNERYQLPPHTYDWSLTKYLQVYLAGTRLPTSIHGEPSRVPVHKTYTERPSTTQWAGLAVCQEWTRSTVSAHWDIEWQQPGPTDSQPHFGNSLPHFGNFLPPFHQYICLWMFGLTVDLLWMWKVAHWCLKNLWQDLATPGVCCFVAQRLVAEFL